ncbi:MAG: lactate utilization protein, partial [Gammaproteobacteria bacterium]|nr:lactate utilization protein [Gammaproteobacteria bacterium]
MQSNAHRFKQRAYVALEDSQLQSALRFAQTGFVSRRQEAIDAFPEFEAVKRAAREIKEHTLQHLDAYLELFEANVVANGGQVHWASTPAEARAIIVDLCKRANARRVTKSKSMIGEEIAVNEALQAVGVDVLETDLGEYIIQLANEPPSHIIAPAIH